MAMFMKRISLTGQDACRKYAKCTSTAKERCTFDHNPTHYEHNDKECSFCYSPPARFTICCTGGGVHERVCCSACAKSILANSTLSEYTGHCTLCEREQEDAVTNLRVSEYVEGLKHTEDDVVDVVVDDRVHIPYSQRLLPFRGRKMLYFFEQGLIPFVHPLSQYNTTLMMFASGAQYPLASFVVFEEMTLNECWEVLMPLWIVHLANRKVGFRCSQHQQKQLLFFVDFDGGDKIKEVKARLLSYEGLTLERRGKKEGIVVLKLEYYLK